MYDCQVGVLSEVVQELSRWVQEVLSRRESQSSSSSSSGIELELELEAELHRAHESLEKVQKHLDRREEELKRRTEQVMELTSKVWETDRMTDWWETDRMTDWILLFLIWWSSYYCDVQDLRFWHWCCWRFKSSEMWHCVVGWTFNMYTQCNISEYLNVLWCVSYNYWWHAL